MLVLSRKKNEQIVIDDDITITVVEIRGDKVRLGVEAPGDVPVHRREVYEAILREEGKIVSGGSGRGGMLVLSRKKNESIVLGSKGEIKIVVVEVRGDKARLGIEAPQEVPIHRREVYEAIRRETEAARGAVVPKEPATEVASSDSSTATATGAFLQGVQARSETRAATAGA